MLPTFNELSKMLFRNNSTLINKLYYQHFKKSIDYLKNLTGS